MLAAKRSLFLGDIFACIIGQRIVGRDDEARRRTGLTPTHWDAPIPLYDYYLSSTLKKSSRPRTDVVHDNSAAAGERNMTSYIVFKYNITNGDCKSFRYDLQRKIQRRKLDSTNISQPRRYVASLCGHFVQQSSQCSRWYLSALEDRRMDAINATKREREETAAFLSNNAWRKHTSN